jgi:hypothetical protein
VSQAVILDVFGTAHYEIALVDIICTVTDCPFRYALGQLVALLLMTQPWAKNYRILMLNTVLKALPVKIVLVEADCYVASSASAQQQARVRSDTV